MEGRAHARLCDGRLASDADISSSDWSSLRDARRDATLCPDCQDRVNPRDVRSELYGYGRMSTEYLYAVPVLAGFDSVRNCSHRRRDTDDNCKAWRKLRKAVAVLRQESKRLVKGVDELRDATGGRTGFAYQFATNLLRIVFPSELAIAGLAERIKERRHEWCMSRVELAERLGVSASKIGSWENGSAPSFEMLEVLADWFSEEPPRWAISMSEMPSAGQRIKKHRLAWGMSQSELGERLGVSVAAIGSWERGGSPSIHKLKLLTGWMAEKPPARRAREAVNAELGKRIKQKRLKIAMSQAALGKHLGVDKNQIRHWGKRS